MTIFTNVEILPKCILFWRSLTQWIGGLGILTFFLVITFRSESTHFQLFSAESHKIDSARPTPSVLKTAVILWAIYALFTLSEVVVLKVLGVRLFDALCHSLTTMSTGGFSTFNTSIDYFRIAGYVHYKSIEYVTTFFMLLGGINFLLHYKILSGRFRDVGNNTELRYFLVIIALSIVLILFDCHRQCPSSSLANLEKDFRRAVFTTVSLLTTTGYGTADINKHIFPVASKQLFLILMLIGGCVGSTGGGFKVLRIIILFKAFKNQLKRLILPQKALSEVVIDHEILPGSEFTRVAGLFFGWIFLIMIGNIIGALFGNLGGLEALSGMFSAVGNIGPCYMSVDQISQLPAIVKITYIFGMLAGRLEILPVLLIFNAKAWK
jgi:trk system potassium uptake protein TrkH